MQDNRNNQYRAILEDDPPEFLDRVNTPWDRVPDCAEYNRPAYVRIVRALKELARNRGGETDSNSQGILVLGEAGTGKTHLLMRVARNLSESNHILFVRKPNNEDAVAQHIWANVVSSLARSLPTSATHKSQLDDLLAHVFTSVLVPELEQDIRDGKDAELKQRWVNHLSADPYNLFNMLGDGEQRQSNLEKIRRRSLRYLQLKHPDVDQTIAHVLITYCFVITEDRKRILLSWLSGQDVDETEAKALGLPTSWVSFDETSTDASIQEQREEQALRAIRTIGILSTYYQPLILAFDQLEGLRDEHRLTQRWGDRVREIFTMTPNFLVVTCIFPSLWESWFKPILDRSVAERIAQQTITLETFAPRYGLTMLATHMQSAFTKHRLPTNIYPFTEADVQSICFSATSPRSFIQNVRAAFQVWLDGEALALAGLVSPQSTEIVLQESIDSLIETTLKTYEDEQRLSHENDIPLEQDFFGRIKSVIESLLVHTGNHVEYSRASCGTKVMPANLVVSSANGNKDVCIGVINSGATAFAARMRNLNTVMRTRDNGMTPIVLRDSRCHPLGARGKEYAEELERMGGVFLYVGGDESATLNAIYDTLVSIEEHDLSIGTHEVDKKQFVEYMRHHGTCRRSHLLRTAASCSTLFANAVGIITRQADAPSHRHESVTQNRGTVSEAPAIPQSTGDVRKLLAETQLNADVVIGDTHLDGLHLGIVGSLKRDNRQLAVSCAKPLCMVVLGYMGSGKSYSLGVLMENALLSIPQISQHRNPMAVVAFNYRSNPEARFEYWGFRQPNSKVAEVERLRSEYEATPIGAENVNVFGYGPELRCRSNEYRGIPTLPIQFRSEELGAEHWQILMKPPTPQTEYMDIIRDIIQKLFYEDRLTFKNLEKHIQTDDRMTDMQRKRAMNRLSFAAKWISDGRTYEWKDVLASGTLNVFDLRMQTMTASDALKLCLIVTDLVRRTRNGVNKLIVFDEAHEYVGSKELVGELENAITQIRHDGLSFILASQFPDRIPEAIFKYLLTRMIFKLPNARAINYVRKAAPNLDGLSPQKVSNLRLEQGVCFVQTDDDCTDSLLKVPQLLVVRPRCTQHGGETVRMTGDMEQYVEESDGESEVPEAIETADGTEPEVEVCPKCGKPLGGSRRIAGKLYLLCSDFPKCQGARRIEFGPG